MTSSAEKMLGWLRGAGVTGATRDELFDGCRIANPSRACDELRQEGHSILEEPVRVQMGPETGVTTRFVLMADGDPQEALFEGERTDLKVLA